MRNCLFFISLLLTFSNAQASVVVGATRVIFDGAKESTWLVLIIKIILLILFSPGFLSLIRHRQ